MKWGGLGGTCVRKIWSVRNSIHFSFVLSDGGYDVLVIGIKEKNVNLIKGFNSLEDIKKIIIKTNKKDPNSSTGYSYHLTPYQSFCCKIKKKEV